MHAGLPRLELGGTLPSLLAQASGPASETAPVRRLSHAYSSDVGKIVVAESRKCPMCGSTTWVLLDGHSTLQALEGGLEALAYSCDECGFIRWHRMDKAEPRA